MKRAANRRLLFLLNVGQRRVQRWTDTQAQAAGAVSSAQAGTLFFLAERDGALIGEIAQTLQIAPSAMTGLADRMCKLQLLERRGDAADGRNTRLYITDEGRLAIQRTKGGLAEVNKRLDEGFTPEEMDVVARWLAALQDKFPSS